MIFSFLGGLGLGGLIVVLIIAKKEGWFKAE
jgi:hypothetical protein